MAVTSKVSICNSAMIKLGAAEINGFPPIDLSKNARLCANSFDRLRDEVLREHAWNFATTRAELARLVEVPEYDFSYYFQLPPDYLRLLSLSDPKIKYTIEEDRIATSELTLKIKYVFRQESPALYDSVFKETLAWRIAWELCIAVTQNRNLAKDMRDNYQISLLSAQNLNSVEDGQIELEASSWAESRA